MFSNLGLFRKTRCPDVQNCERITCLFSHSRDVPAEPAALSIPIHTPKPKPQSQKEQPKPTPSSSSSLQTRTIPSKRTASELQTRNGIATVEPPRKISRIGSTKNPGAIPTSTQTHVSSKLSNSCATFLVHNAQDVTQFQSGVPVLKVTPAQSLVAIPVRQVLARSEFANPSFPSVSPHLHSPGDVEIALRPFRGLVPQYITNEPYYRKRTFAQARAGGLR